MTADPRLFLFKRRGPNFSSPITATTDDAANNSVTDLATLTHTTTGAAGAGIGTGVLLRTEDSAGATENAGRLAAILTTVTDGAEDSALVFYTRIAGAALAEKMRLHKGALLVGTDAPSGAELLRVAGAALFGGALTQSGGAVTMLATGAAMTLTGGAASTLKTSAGAQTIDSAAALNLGTTDATSVAVSRAGVGTTVNGTLAVAQAMLCNAGITASGGAMSFTGNAAGTLTTTVGAQTVDAAAALNLGTTNATSVAIGRSGQVVSVNGVPLFSSSPSVIVNDATTNNVTTCLTLTHTTSGAAAANIGVRQLFQSEDDAGNTDDVAAIDCILTDATSASEDSAIIFNTRTAGAALSPVARFVNAALVIGTTATLANRVFRSHGAAAVSADSTTALDVLNAAASAVTLRCDTNNQFVGVAMTPLCAMDVTGDIRSTKWIYKAADEIINGSAALQDDDHLTTSLAASAKYAIRLVLFVSAANATPGIEFRFNGSVGSSSIRYAVMTDGGAPVLMSSFGGATTGAISLTATTHVVVIDGTIETSTAGTFTLQWAQSVGHASDTKVLENSYMQLMRLT